MPNSGMFYDRKTKTFDVKRAFEERAWYFNNCLKEAERLSKEGNANEAKEYADKLSDEFLDIVITASNYNQ